MSKLIMNGTISSTETENVIYLAENDRLDKFEIQNGDSTTNKILIQGNKVVVTDAANNILYSSNENANITMTGTSYTQNTPDEGENNPPATDPETPTETPTETPNENEVKEPETTKTDKTEAPKDNAPKTGVADYLGIAIFILCISIIGILIGIIL